MSWTKQILMTASLIVFITNISIASDWKENSKAIDISGGEDHTLVLTANKWPWGCGDNYYYQLGIGNNEDQKTLVRVRGPNDIGYLEDISDIDAGWKHSLALDVNNFVWAWGDNYWGQLGDNQDNPYETTPVLVHRGEQPDDPNNQSPYLKRIILISAGRSGEHSLAVDANNYAYAWGYNEYGQCGNGESWNNKLTPVYVHRGEQPLDPNRPSEHLNRIITVSAGEWHSMALEAYDPCDPNMDGRVYTWGDNTFVLDPSKKGVLGNGSSADHNNTPVCVLRGEQDYNDPQQVYLKHIVTVSAGWDHSMALEKNDPCDPNHKGRVYTWGNNGQGAYDSVGGRLGDGSTDSNDTPVLVLRGEQPAEDPNNPYPYLTRITAVSAGEGHSMALDVNGYVYTWGDNQYGQLGDGTTNQSLVPVRVVGEDGVGDLENIVAIAAGYWHCLAIDGDGVVWTWGKVTDGRLGLADMADMGASEPNCSIPHRIPVVYNETQETFRFAIQDAIDDANANDLLVASEGIYYEDVVFPTKTLTLKSMEQACGVVSKNTIIDGIYSGIYSSSHGVELTNNPGSTIAGFTITNSSLNGINAYGSTDPGMIVNNIIRASGQDGIFCSGTRAPAEIRNNWIYDNGWSGIYIDNNDVEDPNVALIIGNTIVGNSHSGIGSDRAADANVTNCIIWGNGSDPNYNLYAEDSGTFDVNYSCIEGGYTGMGNISSDPCFFDDVNDDYHLTWDSNCVDAGDPNFVADANETDIDGNPRVMEPNGGIVDMGADEDYPHCKGPNEYNDWVKLGRPVCWMTCYQCDGDADCATSGYQKYRVYLPDLTIVVDNWEKTIDDPTLNPCADIDHKPSGFWKYRVYLPDMTILVNNWEKKDYDPLNPTDPNNLKGDCASCNRRGEGRSSGLSPKELLEWLAEVWLDPEVRKAIDEDDWFKFIESIKNEM